MLSHIRLHTHTAKINEILHKWRYIHCLQHCTFVPRHVSSQWDGIHCTLPRGRGRRRRARLTTWIEGTAPQAEAGRWKDATMKKRRTELSIREESCSESTFSRISPMLYQEQHLITAVQTTWGFEALIQHIVNNWCASKHWRCMHSWSECINSTCGWSALSLGGFINLFGRQLINLFSLFTATLDQ